MLKRYYQVKCDIGIGNEALIEGELLTPLQYERTVGQWQKDLPTLFREIEVDSSNVFTSFGVRKMTRGCKYRVIRKRKNDTDME